MRSIRRIVSLICISILLSLSASLLMGSNAAMIRELRQAGLIVRNGDNVVEGTVFFFSPASRRMVLKQGEETFVLPTKGKVKVVASDGSQQDGVKRGDVVVAVVDKKVGVHSVLLKGQK